MAKRKVIVRFEGNVIGKRTTARTYTHAVVAQYQGQPFVYGYSGSFALASKLAVAISRHYEWTRVVAVEEAK